LIVWERGQAAQLTAFGDKLLWAERQAQARLASEIAALHANLERAFGMAFDDATHALTVQASHDSALVLLREHCLPVGCTWISASPAASMRYARCGRTAARWPDFTLHRDRRAAAASSAPTPDSCPPSSKG